MAFVNVASSTSRATSVRTSAPVTIVLERPTSTPRFEEVFGFWRAAGDACKRRGGVAGASPRGAE